MSLVIRWTLVKLKQQRQRYPDFKSRSYGSSSKNTGSYMSHNAAIIASLDLLSGKCQQLSNSTPSVSVSVSSSPSWDNPDAITVTSSGLFSQTWQSSSSYRRHYSAVYTGWVVVDWSSFVKSVERQTLSVYVECSVLFICDTYPDI